MKITFYPDSSEIEDDAKFDTISSGQVGRLFKELRKKRPDLNSLVKKLLKKVYEKESIQFLFDTGEMDHLSGDIYEFRIPPQKSGGVVRLYFGYKEKNHIVVYKGELKKGRAADQDLIDSAQKIHNEVCKK
jgi:hypothetical protein